MESLFIADAGAHIFLGFLVHVEAQLFVELLFNTSAAKERAKSDADITEHGNAPRWL